MPPRASHLSGTLSDRVLSERVTMLTDPDMKRAPGVAARKKSQRWRVSDLLRATALEVLPGVPQGRRPRPVVRAEARAVIRTCECGTRRTYRTRSKLESD